MTDDGRRDGDGDGGPAGPEAGGLSPGLRKLEAELRDVDFRPRSGLEEDVLGRISAAPRRPRRRASVSGWRRAARAGVAVLALVGLLGVLERADPPGGGPGAGGGGESTGPGMSEGWAMRWGPDARVLALGAPASAGAGSSLHALGCGRVDAGIRCWGTGPAAIPPPGAAETGAVLRDFCCLDYDGGGPADDGVRVVAGRDEAVVDFWIYEDRDGSRSFSDGDPLRTVVPGAPPPAPVPGAAGGVRRLDRCCADLDGGPRADDGVFVVAGSRERVALAVLYEDENGDGRLSPPDRVRAVRTADGSGPADSDGDGNR